MREITKAVIRAYWNGDDGTEYWADIVMGPDHFKLPPDEQAHYLRDEITRAEEILKNKQVMEALRFKRVYNSPLN